MLAPAPILTELEGIVGYEDLVEGRVDDAVAL